VLRYVFMVLYLYYGSWLNVRPAEGHSAQAELLAQKS